MYNRKEGSLQSSTPERSSNPSTPEGITLRKTARRATQAHHEKLSPLKRKCQGLLSFPQKVKVEIS